MEITILVEPMAGKGFRAISGEPLPMKADAPSREEAVDKIRQLIEARLSEGIEVVNLKLGSAEHPLAPFVGILEGDPLLEPWKAAMNAYRTTRDQQPDGP